MIKKILLILCVLFIFTGCKARPLKAYDQYVDVPEFNQEFNDQMSLITEYVVRASVSHELYVIREQGENIQLITADMDKLIDSGKLSRKEVSLGREMNCVILQISTFAILHKDAERLDYKTHRVIENYYTRLEKETGQDTIILKGYRIDRENKKNKKSE